MEEKQLIALARQGDDAAWMALMEEHQQPVFRLAYLNLGDADEAEDVAQETFIRAFRNLDRFDESRPMRPWLLQISANLARNRRRAVGRYWNAIQRWVQSEVYEDDGVEAGSEAKLESEQVVEAIRRLNPADQQVIYMRFFLELSVRETAQALEIAEGTVKSQTSRALGRLREALKSDLSMLTEGRSDG